MFDLFTPSSKRVMVFTQDEARRLGHHFLCPEHVVLGLIRRDKDPAGFVEGRAVGRGRRRGRSGLPVDPDPAEWVAPRSSLFGVLGLDADALKLELEIAAGRVVQAVGDQFEAVRPGTGPFTESTKSALSLAMREALALGHNRIEPGHILLGLLRKGEPEALTSKLDYDEAKRAIADWLTPRPSPLGDAPEARTRGFAEVTEAAAADAFQRAEVLGSHHLLFALARIQKTLAKKILDEAEVTEEKARELAASLGPEGTLDAPPVAENEIRIGERTIKVDDPESREVLRGILKNADLAERIRVAMERHAKEAGS